MSSEPCPTVDNGAGASARHHAHIVASRRGRWVIKLALALFLSQQGTLSAGEMSIMHSELWRHETLAEESLARGYAPKYVDNAVAESLWKQRLGNMWLTEGFDACVKELEPYFQREFIKQQQRQEQQKQEQQEQQEQQLQPKLKVNKIDLMLSNDETYNECNNATDTDFMQNDTTVEFLKELLSKEDINQQLVKLYRSVLCYIRSVKAKDGNFNQGWFSITDVLSYLHSASCGIGDNIDREEAYEIPVWMPTTPAQLMALLRRLDFVRRLQFCWGNVNVSAIEPPSSTLTSSSLSSLLATTTTKKRTEPFQKKYELCVRAAWAHNSINASIEVINSHPSLPLRQLLLESTFPLACYDFVESVTVLQRHVKHFGGRSVVSFRPFLLLIPGTLLHLNDDSNLTTWPPMLTASGVTQNAAFLRISQTFIDMHMEAHVRVVHPRPDIVVKNLSVDTVWLLPLAEVCPDAIASRNGDMTFIRAELLYAQGVITDITVEALRLMPIISTDESEKNDNTTANTNKQHCRFVQQFFCFDSWTPPQETENNVKNDGEVQSASRYPVVFNVTAARRCLQFFAHECALIAVELSTVDMNVLCTKWLLNNSTFLSRGNVMNSWIFNFASNNFANPSLILPSMLCSDHVVLYGYQMGKKQLRAEIKAGVFNSIYVPTERSKETFNIYFEKGMGNADLAITPMLLLRQFHTAKTKEKCFGLGNKEEVDDSHRAALVVSCIHNNMDTEDVTKSYIAIELNPNQKLQCLQATVNNNNNNEDKGKDKGHNDNSDGYSLQRVAVIVDEWELVALPSTMEWIEREFIVPLEQFLCTTHSTCCFVNLSLETRALLLNNLREQFLIAVTPKMNESLEYLGDAVLDFVFAQKALDTWTHGPIVAGTTNAVLASHLPEALCLHLQVAANISGGKRKADVVEALFGAVVMALWIIPQRNTTGDSTANVGTILFTCVLSVVRKLMELLKIVL